MMNLEYNKEYKEKNRIIKVELHNEYTKVFSEFGNYIVYDLAVIERVGKYIVCVHLQEYLDKKHSEYRRIVNLTDCRKIIDTNIKQYKFIGEHLVIKIGNFIKFFDSDMDLVQEIQCDVGLKSIKVESKNIFGVYKIKMITGDNSTIQVKYSTREFRIKEIR